MARVSLGGCLRWVVICVLALVPRAVDAQEPESVRSGQKQTGVSGNNQVTEPAAVLKVTTRLVVVDVVAKDHKGAPVTGLRQDEFTILEDGKAQEVRVFSFQQHSPPGDAMTQTRTTKVTTPPNFATNIRHFPGNGPLNVLLLDGINTRMDNQQYVKTQLLEFLKKLPADRPMAVYLLGSKLQLLQDFTSDPAVLRTLVENFQSPRSPLMDNATGGPAAFWFEGIPMPPAMKRRILEFQQETESGQADQRVAMTIAALNALARTLAGYPGRKNLIWVSEAFPFSIVPTRAPNGTSADRARRTYSQVAADTANRLTDAQIAVYPIDARALALPDAMRPGVRYDSRGDSLGSPAALSHSLSDTGDELMAAHGTMEEIAEDTGGRASYNRNDIGTAVQQSIDDGSTYYTLGYYPENKSWDGRFRKISVKASRPGLKLRYRLGYFATDPKSYAQFSPKQRDAEFNASLDPSTLIATGLGFEARALPPTDKTQNKAVVIFALEPSALSFSASGDGKHGASVQCAVRVFAATAPDKPLKTEAEDINADLPPESYSKVMRTGLPCRTDFDLSPGEYLLRLSVRDLRTGLIGSANLQLTVPATPPESSKAVESK